MPPTLWGGGHFLFQYLWGSFFSLLRQGLEKPGQLLYRQDSTERCAMTTAREWLVSQGLAKEGRGKFSNDAKAALANAVKEGVKFSDYPKDTTASVEVKEKKESKPKPSDNYGEVIYSYPEESFKAIEIESGKVRSMREVCHTCRVSLVGHGCLTPTIVSTSATGPVAVKIVPIR